MGILSNVQIHAGIQAGTLVTGANLAQVNPCSYDMRIGTIFRGGQIVDGGHPQAAEQVILKPGEVITMFTDEELNLPPDVAGVAFAINSQSSRGLLVLNPGHIDPGFCGPITVKAINIRKVDLALSRGEDIFTVVFERLEQAANPAYKKNKNRDVREREMNKADVELSVASLSALVALSKPFATHTDVHDAIQRHWMSVTIMILTSIGMVAAVLAVVLSGYTIVVASRSPSSASQINTPVGNDAAVRDGASVRVTQEAVDVKDQAKKATKSADKVK